MHEGGARAPPSCEVRGSYETVRSGLALCLTQDAGHLGAAGWANALGESTAICLFDMSGEFTLSLALNAICLAGVAFLGHGALLLTFIPQCGRWRAPPHGSHKSSRPHHRAELAPEPGCTQAESGVAAKNLPKIGHFGSFCGFRS